MGDNDRELKADRDEEGTTYIHGVLLPAGRSRDRVYSKEMLEGVLKEYSQRKCKQFVWLGSPQYGNDFRSVQGIAAVLEEITMEEDGLHLRAQLYDTPSGQIVKQLIATKGHNGPYRSAPVRGLGLSAAGVGVVEDDGRVTKYALESIDIVPVKYLAKDDD
jgi:hypothetical protein